MLPLVNMRISRYMAAAWGQGAPPKPWAMLPSGNMAARGDEHWGWKGRFVVATRRRKAMRMRAMGSSRDSGKRRPGLGRMARDLRPLWMKAGRSSLGVDKAEEQVR